MEDLVLVNWDTPAFEKLEVADIERLNPSMKLDMYESKFTFTTFQTDRMEKRKHAMKEWHFKVDGITIGQLVGTFQSPTRLYINMFQIHNQLRLHGFGKACIELFKKHHPYLKQLCGIAAEDEDHIPYEFWGRCGGIYEECFCCLSKEDCPFSTAVFNPCPHSMSHFMIQND